MRRLLGLLGLVSLLSACSLAPPPPVFSAAEFRGMTVAQVYARLNLSAPGELVPALGYISYDVSAHVVARSAAYRLDSDRSAWTVVVSCYTEARLPGAPDGAREPDLRIALGVVPAAAVTPYVVEQARLRAYDHLLLECPGTSDTFTWPDPSPITLGTAPP